MDSQWLQSLAGGLLIGLAAAILVLGSGRIAGVSGVLGGLVEFTPGARRWRLAFLLGLLAAPLAVWLAGGEVAGELKLTIPAVVGAGLLVGFGTRLGSGCTSGHGVCGLANLSLRSLVATLTFVATAAATVYVVRYLLPTIRWVDPG